MKMKQPGVMVPCWLSIRHYKKLVRLAGNDDHTVEDVLRIVVRGWLSDQTDEFASYGGLAEGFVGGDPDKPAKKHKKGKVNPPEDEDDDDEDGEEWKKGKNRLN